MSEYDTLAARQLDKMHVSDPPELNILNDLALGGTARPASTVTGPTKRKRSNNDTPEHSPHKRVKQGKPKPGAKKLDRVRAQRSGQVASTSPAPRGDIYEYANLSAEKPRPNPAVITKTQRSKMSAPPEKTVEPSKRKAKPAKKTVESSSHGLSNTVTRAQASANTRSTRATAAAKSPGSVFMDGEKDWGKKPEWQLVKKGQQANGAKNGSKSSPRPKGGQPRNETMVAGRSPTVSPAADQDPASSLAVRNAERKGPNVARKSGDAVSGSRTQNKETAEEEVEEVGSEEENEEEGEDCGDANGTGDEHVVENAVSGQDRTAENSEGQVSDSEFSGQGDSDAAAVEEHMDLLGQHEEWERILEAAKGVHQTKITTETIKALHSDIKEGSSTYKELQAAEVADHELRERLTKNLHDALDSIEGQIKNLSEAEVRNKASETIRDIYSRAIPAMVLLLNSALQVRTSQPRSLRSFYALHEIVRIQGMIVELCDKARSWKAKPNTIHPIVRPTTGIILPSVRSMKDQIFEPKLKLLRIQEKTKQNRLATIKAEKDRLEQSQREAELPTQRSRHSDFSIRDHIIEEQQRWLNSMHPRYSKRPLMPADLSDDGIRNTDRSVSDWPARKNSGPHVWTEEESLELIQELSRSPEGLTTEERYLRALNRPLLQNMLAERLREHILSLKADLMAALDSPPWLCSIT